MYNATELQVAGPSKHALSEETREGSKSDDEDDGDEGGGSSKRAKTSAPSKRACARCRGIKVRCQEQEPSNGKCVRCTRLNFECIWVEPQKRGRKADAEKRGQPPPVASTSKSGGARSASSDPTRNSRASASSTTSQPLSTASDLNALSTAPQVLPAALPSFGLVSAGAAPLPLSLPPIASTSQLPSTFPTDNIPFFPDSAQPPVHTSPHGFTLTNGSSHSGRPASSHDSPGSFSNPSPRPSLPSLSMMELANAKEAALQNLGKTASFGRPATNGLTSRASAPTAGGALREPDPVDMHLVSEMEALQLFEHYHTKMNGFIILLDPYLHKVDYVRKTSTVLFTSILAVSAKFIRTDLYPSLLMSAKQLVGRGFIDGKVSVGLIQSVLLQVYWKEPEDRSAWLRIGLAVRIGYQLHLNAQRTTPLPDDELEAREILDRERTWIDLCAFDHTFLLQVGDDDDGFHQTCMIPHYRINIQQWLAESKPYGVTDDIEQGANFEWIEVQRLSKDIARARVAHARSLGHHLQGMLDSTYQRYLCPTSSTALEVGCRQWIRVNYFVAATSLSLARAMLTAVGNDAAALSRWVTASDTLVDAFEIVAKHGFVAYWQDTLGITLFSMGEFCVKIFSTVYPATQTTILSWMERIYRACELSPDDRGDSTTAFISRFFQLCIRGVCTPSPPSMTEPAAAATAPGSVATLPFPIPSAPTSNNGDSQAAPTSVLQMGTSTTNFDPFQSISLGEGDTSYWESLFPGQATDWSWLDQPFEDLVQQQ